MPLFLTIALLCLLPALAAAQEYHPLPPEPPEPGPVQRYEGVCGAIHESLVLGGSNGFRLRVSGSNAAEELDGRWRAARHAIILVGALQEARYDMRHEAPRDTTGVRTTVLTLAKGIRWTVPRCPLVARDSSAVPADSTRPATRAR